jgi:hypothetical protein
MPIKEVSVYKVQSETDPNDWYQVMVDKEHSAGSWCTCKEFFKNRYCEHIDRVKLLTLYGA